MNTKIVIAATVAAMSLATTAFAAGEGRGGPAPAQTSLYAAGLNNQTLPEDGQNGAVQSPNAVPPGAMVGTEAYRRAQSVDLYFAQQADRRFAQARRLRPNG